MYPATNPRIRDATIEMVSNGGLFRRPEFYPSYKIDLKGFDDDYDVYKCMESAIETVSNGGLFRRPESDPSYKIDLKGFDGDYDGYKRVPESEMTETEKYGTEFLSILALKTYQEYFDEDEYSLESVKKVVTQDGLIGGGNHYLTFTAQKIGYDELVHTFQAIVTCYGGICPFVLYIKIIDVELASWYI